MTNVSWYYDLLAEEETPEDADLIALCDVHAQEEGDNVLHCATEEEMGLAWPCERCGAKSPNIDTLC